MTDENVNFWIVIRNKEAASYISKRHPSEDTARAEAERLCKKENGRFHVLHTVAYVDPNEPPVTWHEVGGAPEVSTSRLDYSRPIYNLHGDWIPGPQSTQTKQNQ
jgi:hypothetical protein